MPKLAQWSESYAIGIENIDQQHRYLFDLFKQLQDVNERSQFEACFMKVYRYTREHFSAEEKIMKEHHYPKYEYHCQLHNKLLFKFNELAQKVINDFSYKEELITFLGDWLVFHIVGEDMELGTFIENNT